MTTTDVQQPDYGRYQQKIQLTPEETKIWYDCMKNSSSLVPMLTGAAIGYGAVKLTRYHARSKYAAFAAGTIGLLWSKLYISESCLMKVAALPNSNLRERLTKAGYYGENYMSKRYQGFAPLSTDTTAKSQNLEESSTEIVFDDYPPMQSFDTYSSLNDSSYTQTSEDMDLTEPINMQKSTSYEELRYKNREEFYKKNQQRYSSKVPEKSTVISEPSRQIPPSTQEKTKYGDSWD